MNPATLAGKYTFKSIIDFSQLIFFSLFSFFLIVNSSPEDDSYDSFDTTPIHYARFISHAVNYGIEEANQLFEQLEPKLYQQDLVIKGDHPSVYLAAINRQSPKAKELARVAYATIKATSNLKEQLAEVGDEKPQISDLVLTNTVLGRSECPTKRQLNDECPSWTRKYRKVDGTCNNLKDHVLGSSFQPFGRYLSPDYDDGVSTLRKSVTGNELPSARSVSIKIHRDISKPSATFTQMLMQWGQFVDHDLTATSQTRSFNHSIPRCCHVPDSLVHPDCLVIKIPKDDPYFNDTNCMEFLRSSPAPRHDCSFGPREQLNQITPWLDGSAIYGSTENDLQTLRKFTGGLLKYHHMPNRKSLLPQLVHPPEGECFVSSPRLFCFAAGDIRANEQPALTTMHTIWMRQHNLIAKTLAAINPHWNEETLFQEARKIVIAQIQFITFREFLPLILGPAVLRIYGLRVLRRGYYHGYNHSVDPTIPSSFAAAAFRFGHSMVQPNIHRCDEGHREMPYKIELSQEMMSPTNIHNLGEVDRISLGLASQPSQRRDEFITSQLTNHLFETSRYKGLDLAALNVQRGRDHGIPSYLKWREACGLNRALADNKPISSWEQFSLATGITLDKVRRFAEVYESPWDVDLFPGGMVEHPIPGGIIGPTFTCIIAQTFRNIRNGDRFWFENPNYFTPDQLEAIRNISLARVFCDNSDSIETIQRITFLAPHDTKNPYVDCSDSSVIPQVFYGAWYQYPLTPSQINIPPQDNFIDPISHYSFKSAVPMKHKVSNQFTPFPRSFVENQLYS